MRLDSSFAFLWDKNLELRELDNQPTATHILCRWKSTCDFGSPVLRSQLELNKLQSPTWTQACSGCSSLASEASGVVPTPLTTLLLPQLTRGLPFACGAELFRSWLWVWRYWWSLQLILFPCFFHGHHLSHGKVTHKHYQRHFSGASSAWSVFTCSILMNILYNSGVIYDRYLNGEEPGQWEGNGTAWMRVFWGLEHLASWYLQTHVLANSRSLHRSVSVV